MPKNPKKTPTGGPGRKPAAARVKMSADAPRPSVVASVSVPREKAAQLPPLTFQVAQQAPDLRIRTAAGETFVLDARAPVEHDAMSWVYALRHRDRWREGDALRRDHARRSANLLERLGLTPGDVEVLARARVAEVEIPYREEAEAWALRLLPWEFVLSAATSELREGQPLTVVRWLHRVAAIAPARPALGTVLLVESAPGQLRSVFDFTSERRLVSRQLGLDVVQLRDPTLAQLGEAIRQRRPDIVHLAGCDNHQAADLVAPGEAEGKLDGYALLGERKGIDYVEAERLAGALTGFGAHLPSFVGFNFWNSAGRVAAMAVALGCGAAVGFQDVMDDELCEVFWSNFYAAWAKSRQGLIPAFEAARLVLRAKPMGHYGSGITLWTESSLVGAPQTAVERGSETKRLAEVLVAEKTRLISPRDVEGLENVQLVDVKADPVPRISYALLHNGRRLFTRFDLRKLIPGQMTGVRVEVTVNFGSDSFPFRQGFTLTEDMTSLVDKVHVALTSDLSRTPSEAIHTSVWIRVCWGERTLYESTESVVALPVDEWTDSDEEDQWLPSFMFRRDPAVAQVVGRAQRYLVALTDDPSAGFGGYQNIDEEAEDPCLGVDQQVQALWYALTQDLSLAYINPPPSTTALTQRLRTPSDVVEGGRGTCIDLALLLGACLEYIDISPAIVLLDGHAFPAYWRSDVARDAFCNDWKSGRLEAPESAGPQSPTAPAAARAAQWLLPRVAYRGVLQQVRERHLVPIETVWLTKRSSFAEALEEGVGNLRSKSDFHSLIDISLAREFGVTPLPLLRWREA